MNALVAPPRETQPDAGANADVEHWSECNGRYLAASLHWLRLRLQRLAPPEGAAQQAQGLAHWFARRSESDDGTPQRVDAARVSLDARIAAAADARMRAGAATPGGSPPALPILAERLGLDPFEADILLLCIAMELDPSMAGLLAAAHGATHPSFALALRLFDDPAWDALAPQRPLRHQRLIEINQPGATPLTAAALRADERIVNFAKGLNLIDERVASACMETADLPPISESQRCAVHEAIALMAATRDGGEPMPPVLQLMGRDRGSRQAIAAHIVQALGLRLHRLALEAMPTARPEVETFARLWLRESLLLPVALYVEADELDHAGADANAALQTLLAQPVGLVLVGLRETPLRLRGPAAAIEAPPPTSAEQHAAWCSALAGARPGAMPDAMPAVEAEAELLAGHFQLNLDDIGQAARRARIRGAEAWDVCRDQALVRLDALAQRLQPKARWDDLVLGEEATGLLRRISEQVHARHRVYQQWGYAERMNRGMGISALFAGESGTGKTMAAEVIANELRMHLYRIDLSSVVSKYIGETEKNLRRLFDAAEQGGAILFFDEADALFGKRSEVKDSHDRYANIEINYLLQRMEAFSGLAILATNMKSALDTAFMRRLRFVVNFQFPGPQERARIWRNAFAAGVPCDVLDHDRLARFSLSGGNIHSIALNAAFSAAARGCAVTMPLLLATLRAELRKLDKPVNEAEFR
jgi:hypothetical protein